MTSVAALRPSAGEHVVHFYDDEPALAAVVATYLGAALADGGTAIAIVTPAHRPAFTAELLRRGVDLPGAERAGQSVFMDARATLSQLLVDGAPDRDRFHEVVTAAIAGRKYADGPVRVFGEMVGLLWEIGDVHGVMGLERLWNESMTDVAFSLLCGCPATVLNGESADSAVDMCDSHSAVVSQLPVPAGPAASSTFARTPQSPGRARGFVAAVLRAWGVAEELYDDAALVVTELAVNAIKHANSAFTVSLDRIGAGVCISVGDADPTPPARRIGDVRATSGRGLLLVDAVATAWGSSPADGGKLVWAELGHSVLGRR